ncbi:hypothetical protein BAE44_0018266 [Dichanthelium oligosanthes]|uniref:F-box domain-containing protein n=1 Tax=Dichanthelium oligosanthes TaxID=888268 RepID=A0A1E5V6H6_9POAL|nr:hypothetical protein BAE44_0018266 [Dichanthelium oligosanthes]
MVGQRTTSIKDYVRLRAVCKSWRSFLRPKSTPPQAVLRLVARVAGARAVARRVAAQPGHQGARGAPTPDAPWRGVVLLSPHAEGRQGEVGGLRLPQLPPPADLRDRGAQGGPVVGPVRRRRLHGHGASRRRGGRVLQTGGRVVEDPRVRTGGVQRRGRDVPGPRVPARQPLRARRGVRPRLAAARGAHAPGRAPRPRAHVGRPVPRPAPRRRAADGGVERERPRAGCLQTGL